MRYSYEVYKRDGRFKKGERLVEKGDDCIPPAKQTKEKLIQWLERRYPEAKGFRHEIHETYVTRINHITKEKYQERYDTPDCCSPSTELYWTM